MGNCNLWPGHVDPACRMIWLAAFQVFRGNAVRPGEAVRPGGESYRAVSDCGEHDAGRLKGRDTPGMA